MGAYDEIYNKLAARLNDLRRRTKRIHLANGGLRFMAVLLLSFLLIAAIESVFYLRPLFRSFALGTAVALAVVALVWLIVRPIYSLYFRKNIPDNHTLAMRVGTCFTGIRDRLADALQVFQKHRKNPEGYSLDLADASLVEVNKEVADLDFGNAAPTSSVRKNLRIFAGAVTLTLFSILIFHSVLLNAADRLFHPWQEYSKFPQLSFQVEPGNAEVVKGQSLEISAKVRGADVSRIDLYLKNADAEEFEKQPLIAELSGNFSYVIDNLSTDFEYFVSRSSQRSETYAIDMVELPYIRNVQLKIIYPRYSKLGSQFLDENVGDVSALKGSTIEFFIKSNKTVKDAEVVFDNGKKLPLQISGQEIAGKFKMMRAGSYHFRLVDRSDRENENPIEYRMTFQEDQLPLVQITFPGQDVDLSEDLLLPLSIEAEDDFGFSKVRLGYVLAKGGIIDGEQQFLDLLLPKDSGDKFLLNYNWVLSKLRIQPEDVVTYFAEAFDNDVISGPKSSRSLTYRVRFPSIYEMYDDVARGQEEAFEELENVYEESKELQKELKQIVQEMKREPELDWQEKQEVQEAAQSQEKMRKSLESIQEKMDEMINRMEQNDLMSTETLDKYRELQQLMEEMLTPELREAMAELQKSMEELDPQKLKDAMEKFAASQEDFLKSIERTLNLLKKLEIEQKMDEVVRKTQDLLRRQDELNKQAQQSQGKQDQSKYAQEEKGIRQDSDNLSQDLDKLNDKMGEFPNMPQDQIQSAQNQMGEKGLQSQMENAIQQFQSGDMQGAQQSGQQISQDLQQMLESLQNAQQQLSEDQKKAVMQALSRASHDLLNLSKQQESLRQQTQGMDRNSPEMNQTADRQQDLLSGLSRTTNKLFDLSQSTFFVTPEIGKALGKSTKGMQESLKGLEGRNSGKSGKGQGEAMSGLNEAVAELRKSMQSLSGSSSSIGFQEMMQRMMGISNQQQGINQQTAGMGQKPGGLSMGEQAAMSRLAAEQEALRKSLEQLRGEAGNRSELLGDLEKVGQDMEEVVKDFQRRNVNPNTINRQKRILSRLLDAQRSVHNRDFSKKRKAETGKKYRVVSPNALPSDLLSSKDRLKNELLKAMKEGYSKDYRELIRRYFDSLSREQEGESLNN